MFHELHTIYMLNTSLPLEFVLINDHLVYVYRACHIWRNHFQCYHEEGFGGKADVFAVIACLNAVALYNPTYLAGTPSLELTTGLQGQDDALAADYLEPVATLPAWSTKNEWIKAKSSNCRAKEDDQVNEFELGVLSSQKLDLMPEPRSVDGADEEKSQDHTYATLGEATIKE